MRSMTVVEFEAQIRKTQVQPKADATTQTSEAKKPADESWWENYRSGSFC